MKHERNTDAFEEWFQQSDKEDLPRYKGKMRGTRNLIKWVQFVTFVATACCSKYSGTGSIKTAVKSFNKEE